MHTYLVSRRLMSSNPGMSTKGHVNANTQVAMGTLSKPSWRGLMLLEIVMSVAKYTTCRTNLEVIQLHWIHKQNSLNSAPGRCSAVGDNK